MASPPEKLICAARYIPERRVTLGVVLLAVLIEEQAFRETKELFVFSAFLRDVPEIDQERYMRDLFGPFASKGACDKQERSFQAAGIGTLACTSWSYK
jgi:hypothetical protein